MNNADDFVYVMTLDDFGLVTLSAGNEQLWTSDGDDEFCAEFGDEVVDEDQLPDVKSWLIEEGIIPPGVEVEFETLDDEDDTDEGEDE